MGEILDLAGKRDKRVQETVRAKLEAARRIFLCSGCPSKCAKCGTQLDVRIHACPAPDETYNLCEPCAEEWAVYQKVRQGDLSDKLYYHNDEWISLWESWTYYQRALLNYRKSKEFQQLLSELER